MLTGGIAAGLPTPLGAVWKPFLTILVGSSLVLPLPYDVNGSYPFWGVDGICEATGFCSSSDSMCCCRSSKDWTCILLPSIRSSGVLPIFYWSTISIIPPVLLFLFWLITLDLLRFMLLEVGWLLSFLECDAPNSFCPLETYRLICIYLYFGTDVWTCWCETSLLTYFFKTSFL